MTQKKTQQSKQSVAKAVAKKTTAIATNEPRKKIVPVNVEVEIPEEREGHVTMSFNVHDMVYGVTYTIVRGVIDALFGGHHQ